MNEQNQARVFSRDPAVMYRKATLTSHADLKQYRAAIEAEGFYIPQGISKQRECFLRSTSV